MKLPVTPAKAGVTGSFSNKINNLKAHEFQDQGISLISDFQQDSKWRNSVKLSSFWNLLTPREREKIANTSDYNDVRHPTWYPLFAEKLLPIDLSLDSAVATICNAGDEAWLNKHKNKLTDLKDPSNASAFMAEIRVYGGLLEAGFCVSPVSEDQVRTPDFKIASHGGPVEVEIAAKHPHQPQQALLDAVQAKDAEFPQGVDYSIRHSEGTTIEAITFEYQPGGEPNPEKRHDSVQTNVISRIAQIKEKETQFSSTCPAVLAIDLTSFGIRDTVDLMLSKQIAPLISGYHGLTSGALWYAMYGWKGAPVFEEGTSGKKTMQHEGRFRLNGDEKSELSAVLIVLPNSVVLFENPWATCRLPDDARFAFCKYPCFDLTHSICDWQEGMVEQLLTLQEHTITALEQKFDEMQTFWRA